MRSQPPTPPSAAPNSHNVSRVSVSADFVTLIRTFVYSRFTQYEYIILCTTHFPRLYHFLTYFVEEEAQGKTEELCGLLGNRKESDDVMEQHCEKLWLQLYKKNFTYQEKQPVRIKPNKTVFGPHF